MANAEHVAKLKEGPSAWNKWRGTTPDEIDLRSADLRSADLVGANLNLADLSEANLQSANLQNSKLQSAKLRAANLSGAQLQGADLKGAQLEGGDLSRTNLANVSFLAANLSGATLTEDLLYVTLFTYTNLRNARGLNTCKHATFSILDPMTLNISGTLPTVFLRGCGLPEAFITYLPSLLNQSIQFYSCFISYSTKDQAFADRLYADLQNKGVRCWFAPHDMAPGKKIHEQIDEAIRLHDKLLLILSKNSMNSEWVKTEIARARKREIKEKRRMLFPVSLAGFKPLKAWECFDEDTGKDSAREIREYFIPDFSTWYKNHDAYKENFDRLLDALKANDAARSHGA